MIKKKTNPISPLTPREIDVLKYIQQGFHNKDIAQVLYISNNTVKSHIKNIYLKINVDNKVQAVLKGKEFGYIL